MYIVASLRLIWGGRGSLREPLHMAPKTLAPATLVVGLSVTSMYRNTINYVSKYLLTKSIVNTYFLIIKFLKCLARFLIEV